MDFTHIMEYPYVHSGVDEIGSTHTQQMSARNIRLCIFLLFPGKTEKKLPHTLC